MDEKPVGTSQTALREWVEKVYDEHGQRLYRYALMILASHEAAQDAVQEAFTKLLRRRRGEPDLANLAAYLHTAVRNECYSQLRRRRREPQASQDPAFLEALEPTGHDETERLGLERALGALSPEQREVVHLKVYEGWTFQEIADALGQSINTVASRYRYGLDKLRARLIDAESSR